MKEFLVGLVASLLFFGGVSGLIYVMVQADNNLDIYSCVDGVTYHKTSNDVWIKSRVYGECMSDEDMKKRGQ